MRYCVAPLGPVINSSVRVIFCPLLLCVRDVLPVRLTLPRWICSDTDKSKAQLSQLKPGELGTLHLKCQSRRISR